jgi:flavin reductase (DIM6/NTAB) family NADH-FMN oxidoreductase RutF
MRTTFLPEDPDLNPYRLLTDLVVPRPIAWVSTESADGVGNLAPHSFFSIASSRPPIVCFTSVGRKDTLNNVLATEEFVVNFATRAQMDLINASSAQLAADVSEAESLGIAMEPSVRVRPPRVVDSPAAIECVLHSTYDVGNSVMVFGLVVAISVRNAVLVDGRPEFTLLDPVSRLGRDEWGVDAQVISTPRPS